MTYATSNPPALVTQRVGASGGAVWIYKDGDSLDDVGDTNYFTNAADLGMKAGDKLIHIDTTEVMTADLVVSAHRTSGTAAGALGSAIEAIGVTSIALQSAGTGTFLIGDIVTFDNDEAQTPYEITTGDTDISDGGTLVITPGLVVATAVGTKILIKSGVLNATIGDAGQRTIASSPATYLIKASESGTTFLFDAVAGQVFTLPVGQTGMKFRFLVTVTLTSAAYSVVTSTATAGDFLVGSLNGAIEGAATGEVHFANGTTHLGMSMNKTTTGGLVGGHMELTCVKPTLWQITGVQSCTTTPLTPFTT